MENQEFKADGGKTNPLLLERDMAQALDLVNRVLDYGAEKYEATSWKRVAPERYEQALRRHRRDRDLGEDFDRESGLLHLAHEACNALFLLQMAVEGGKYAGIDLSAYKKPPLNHKPQQKQELQTPCPMCIRGVCTDLCHGK